MHAPIISFLKLKLYLKEYDFLWNFVKIWYFSSVGMGNDSMDAYINE